MATKVKLIAAGVITPSELTLTTASTGTNTTAPATTAFVQQEISALVDSSPAALNTLNELAAALGDDANFSTTVNANIAAKMPLAGGTMTGALNVTGTITGDDGLSIQGGTGNAYLQVGSDTGSWTWRNYRSTHKLALEDADGTGEVLNFDTSGNATFAGTISSSGNLGVGQAQSNGTGTKILEVNTPAASALGPEILIHNRGQGADAKSALTFGGKRSGLEGYTGAIFTTNNDGMFFATAAATDFNGLPTTALQLDENQNAIFEGDIKTTGLIEVASSQPRILLDRSDGAYSWNIYNGDGSGNFPNSTFNIANNAGTAVITALDNGNVGINTTSPRSKLNVQGTSASTYTGDGPGPTIRASQGTDGNWIASDVDGKFAYFGVDGNDAKFAAYNYASTTEMGVVLGQSRMYIKNNGNVGIGTTNPLDLLHINSSSGDVRQLMNAPTGSDAEIKFAEGGNVQYTIGHDAGSGEFRIGGTNVDSDVFLRAKSAGAGTNISIGRGGEEDGLAGLQVMRGGVLINGGYNDMGAINSHYTNVWTWVGCSGLGGTFNGSVRVNIPNPTGGASGYGYGGFSMEVYVAGYSGKYCHAFLSGYTNNGITLSENAIRASNGGWSTSYGTITSQGFYFDINYPSGLIHPSIYIRVSKGGHTAGGRGTDFNDINVAWS